MVVGKIDDANPISLSPIEKVSVSSNKIVGKGNIYMFRPIELQPMRIQTKQLIEEMKNEEEETAESCEIGKNEFKP